MLTRGWLNTNVQCVKQFDTLNVEKGKKGFQSEPDSYRSIANFLSKKGKTISRQTVKNYLDIADKLNPEIKVKKQSHAPGKNQSEDDGSLGVREALKLSTITEDWDEQQDLVKALKNTRQQHGNDKNKNLTEYKKASDEIKQKVRVGELDLADIKDAVIDMDVKKLKTPTYEFIPNFAGRLRQFSDDVDKLVKQVNAFRVVFHSENFVKKYNTLKTNQKKKLHSGIDNIYSRISKCYEEVEYFKGLLSDKELLEEYNEK